VPYTFLGIPATFYFPRFGYKNSPFLQLGETFICKVMQNSICFILAKSVVSLINFYYVNSDYYDEQR
jgi:hypothetical protein